MKYENEKPSKKKHWFPKPTNYRGAGYVYSFLPFMWFSHPIGRRDQEEEIVEYLRQKNIERDTKRTMKK